MSCFKAAGAKAELDVSMACTFPYHECPTALWSSGLLLVAGQSVCNLPAGLGCVATKGKVVPDCRWQASCAKLLCCRRIGSSTNRKKLPGPCCLLHLRWGFGADGGICRNGCNWLNEPGRGSQGWSARVLTGSCAHQEVSWCYSCLCRHCPTQQASCIAVLICCTASTQAHYCCRHTCMPGSWNL